MAQVSQRVRQLRRVKRERSLLRRAIGVQQQQLQTVVGLLQQAQAEVRALKPRPSITIRTLPDDTLDILKDYERDVVDDTPFIDPDYSEPVEDAHDVTVDPAAS